MLAAVHLPHVGPYLQSRFLCAVNRVRARQRHFAVGQHPPDAELGQARLRFSGKISERLAIKFKLQKRVALLLSAVQEPLIAAVLKHHEIRAESAAPSGPQFATACRATSDRFEKSGTGVSHEC